MMRASRGEDDNNDTKEKYDVMIAKQQLLVDGLANRGHTKGVPQTGDSAKGIPKTGDGAKGPANWKYVDIPGRPECKTAGCTLGKRADGRTLAGTRKRRKTCCRTCK